MDNLFPYLRLLIIPEFDDEYLLIQRKRKGCIQGSFLKLYRDNAKGGNAVVSPFRSRLEKMGVVTT